MIKEKVNRKDAKAQSRPQRWLVLFACLLGLNFAGYAQRSVLPDGDTLVYNSGTGQWIRHPYGGGGNSYSSLVPIYKADSSITYYSPRQTDSLLGTSATSAIKWIKMGTYRYNYFHTALPQTDTFVYSGYSLPARGMLMAIMIKLDTAFNNSGGPYSYTVGISDGNGGAMSINFIMPQNITIMPVSGGLGPLHINTPSQNYGFESMTSVTQINIVVHSTDLLNNTVQGSMEVYALVTVLP